MMYSTKGVPTPSGPSRTRNRYTISAINSVIASSTGIQLATEESVNPPNNGFPAGIISIPLEPLLESASELATDAGGCNPVDFGEEQETST
jgi:hypothetical protein